MECDTSSDAVTTTYVYDAQSELAAEYKSCTTAVNCVDGSPPPATEYLTADHLGSTRLVTDGSANPVECRDYLPFGEEILMPTNGAPRQGIPCLTQDGRVRQLFTGKEQDTETGLDYFEARYMSAAQGRFISPDPSNAGARPEDPQSWNMFAYARNNPLLYTDQDGRRYRICDTGGNCSDEYSDDDFDKNLSGKARGGAIRQGGEVIGYYQRLSFDDLSTMGNLFFNKMSLRRDASNQFIINFAKESVKTAVTGALLGKVVRVGAEAYLAYRAAQATAAAAEAAAAEVTGLVVQAVQTVSNTGAVASSREIALQAAEEWVGIGSKPIRRLVTGEVVGRVSANGQRVYRTTSLGKAEPYINLENKATGGNLHVRF